MNNLGIEFISVFGMPPVEFVGLAADLGCRHISGGLQTPPGRYNPHGYRPYSLKEDRALRGELVAALKDRGVSISLGEGFAIWPNGNVRQSYAADLDVMSELGIARINSVSFETDRNRSFDQLGVLAEMAEAHGIETMLEFVPTFGIADLPTALAAVRHVDRRNFKILIDTMHVGRSGARAADIAALDPDAIGYVQLCDAPLAPKFPTTWKRRCMSGWCRARANCPCATSWLRCRAIGSSVSKCRSVRWRRQELARANVWRAVWRPHARCSASSIEPR